MEILEVLKIDLQISSKVYDDYLNNLISLARAAIEKEGIEIKDDVEDGMLIETYAAYLYRSKKSGANMPRHLRYMLNNRLLSQKAGV